MVCLDAGQAADAHDLQGSPCVSRAKLLRFPLVTLSLFITVRQLMRLINQVRIYMGLWVPNSFRILAGLI